MASEICDEQPLPDAIKILVTGGFGAGKTTAVRAVSEIRALLTEEQLTDCGVGVDDLEGVEGKTTTTVALDFGRITLHSVGLVLYLFGTPGQPRFSFMWDELARGAMGAIVVVDTRRLDHCFDVIDFLEIRGVPFVIAINRFPNDEHHYTPAEVRESLDVASTVPILECDARENDSMRRVVIDLCEHLLTDNP